MTTRLATATWSFCAGAWVTLFFHVAQVFGLGLESVATGVVAAVCVRYAYHLATKE